MRYSFDWLRLRGRVRYASHVLTHLRYMLSHPVIMTIDTITPYVAFLWYERATLQDHNMRHFPRSTGMKRAGHN